MRTDLVAVPDGRHRCSVVDVHGRVRASPHVLVDGVVPNAIHRRELRYGAVGSALERVGHDLTIGGTAPDTGVVTACHEQKVADGTLVGDARNDLPCRHVPHTDRAVLARRPQTTVGRNDHSEHTRAVARQHLHDLARVDGPYGDAAVAVAAAEILILNVPALLRERRHAADGVLGTGTGCRLDAEGLFFVDVACLGVNLEGVHLAVFARQPHAVVVAYKTTLGARRQTCEGAAEIRAECTAAGWRPGALSGRPRRVGLLGNDAVAGYQLDRWLRVDVNERSRVFAVLFRRLLLSFSNLFNTVVLADIICLWGDVRRLV
eukprot:PhM_4_TR833/c0_g1_i1/m.59563